MRRTFILPVFMLLSLLALPHLSQTLDLEGLVLYLPFDEGQGKNAADLSGNGNDGTLENGVEWVDGYFGKGVYLAEIPDHVEVPDSPTLDLEESLTLAIWANIESLPDGSCALFMKATSYMLHTTTGGDGVKIDPLVFMPQHTMGRGMISSSMAYLLTVMTDQAAAPSIRMIIRSILVETIA